MHFNRMKPYVACSVSESVGQDNQITPEDRTAKRHLEVQSRAKEDTGPSELQQENGDQRMEARGSLPEPCP